MKSFRLRFCGIASIGFLTLHLSAWALQSPLMMIRSTVEQAMAILRDPSYQGKDHFQERLRRLEGVVLPQIDSWEIAKRSLGVHWRKINEEQRKKFIRLFTELIEKSYGNMLDRYPQGVQFFFDQERIEDNFAEVDTRVFNPNRDKPFLITYRLHQVGRKWLIYDVVVENVSMVGNYRNQFSRIISRSSYEGLVQALEQKLKQLETAPSS
jgi:phospholipid transport system substrate-binding protein